MDEPYLDLKDENAFTPPGVFAQKYPAVAHVTSVALLKIRILFDLRALKSVITIGERAPHLQYTTFTLGEDCCGIPTAQRHKAKRNFSPTTTACKA